VRRALCLLFVCALFPPLTAPAGAACGNSFTIQQGPIDAANRTITLQYDWDGCWMFLDEWFRNQKTVIQLAARTPPVPRVLNVACMDNVEIVTIGDRLAPLASAPIAPLNSTPMVRPRLVEPSEAGSSAFVLDYDFSQTNGAVRSIVIEALPTATHGQLPIAEITGLPDTVGTVGPFETAYDGVARIVTKVCSREYEQFFELSGNACDGCRSSCADCVGDPVRTATGNMRLSDTDPLPGSAFLPLKRTYDSTATRAGAFGLRWTSLFDATLRFGARGTDTTVFASVLDEGGNSMAFTRTSAAGAAAVYAQSSPVPAGPTAQLVPVTGTTNWAYLDASRGRRRIFDANGRVIRYEDVASGRAVDITRDAAGLPTRVADAWGNWAWLITMTSGRITSIAAESNASIVWQYTYSDAHLTTVTSPLGVWRTYEGSGADRRITAVRNEMNQLIESHAYDAKQRATDSYGPAGEIESIAYWQPGRVAGESSSVIQWKNGRVERHYMRSIAGRMRTVEIANGCASCASDGAVMAYDRAGNVVRRQSARGYVTESEYGTDRQLKKQTDALRPAACDPETDPARCWQTPEGLATVALVPSAASVTTTYSFSTTWPDRTVEVRRTSIAKPGEMRTIQGNAYDAVTGQVLSSHASGYSGTAALRRSP
jgi:YD repeat-containing protein